MRPQTNNYMSYLLRIWNDSSNGEWHATLQDVFNGDCYHFATLYELYVNLCECTSENPNEPPDQPLEPLFQRLSGTMP